MSSTKLPHPTLSASRSRWLAAAVLALPFAVMIAVLRGMTATLPIFHGSDERVYQYPTILRFSHQLPFPDLHSYKAAQTPLFHLLMAYAGEVIGFSLWRLRLLEVLISYLLALAVYALLHRRLGTDRVASLALTLLFVLSPYVFGNAFRLMTDNLALLFSVLALDRFERSRQLDGSLATFAIGCVCASAAVLTRQSSAFLFGVAVLCALWPGVRLSRPERGVALLAVALAAVPPALLFLNWHGLVAPGGDPSSCGLCTASSAGGATVAVPTTALALATVGLYGAVLFAPCALAAIRNHVRAGTSLGVREAAGLLAAAGAGLVLVGVFPFSGAVKPAGAIWKASTELPSLDGTSLLLWVLIPLASVVLWLRLRVTPHRWITATLALGFLISTLVIRFAWQKYVDPFALLLLLTTVRRNELSCARMLLGAVVLAVAFAAYAADYAAHRSTPVRATAAPHRL